MKKLAILAAHPVYYQTPLWKALAAEPTLEVKVFFENKMAVGEYYDPEFGKMIDWKLPLLQGYKHEFIPSPYKFIKQLKQGNFDALLVNSWNSKLTWIAVLAAKLMGIKVMLRAENPWNQEKGRKGMKQAFRHFALLSLFAMVDAFLYIGEENKKFYLAYGVSRGKLFYTPYAVDNQRLLQGVLDTSLARQNIRQQFNISKDAVVVLTVGKLISKKRPMDLLMAYAEMAYSNKALIFAGEGELRAGLEEYIAKHNIKNVHFAGFVGQNEIGSYYAGADIFVLASGHGETWGLVVNEAMCFGLPIIASDVVGSATDLVHPNENGFIVPCGAVPVLAEKLDLLAADPVLRAKFSRASQSIIEKYNYKEDVAGILKAIT